MLSTSFSACGYRKMEYLFERSLAFDSSCVPANLILFRFPSLGSLRHCRKLSLDFKLFILNIQCKYLIDPICKKCYSNWVTIDLERKNSTLIAWDSVLCGSMMECMSHFERIVLVVHEVWKFKGLEKLFIITSAKRKCLLMAQCAHYLLLRYLSFNQLIFPNIFCLVSS